MNIIDFKLEKGFADSYTLVKVMKDDLNNEVRDELCTTLDLDQLFDVCVKRWGNNWNLEKVMVAIKESEID